MKGGWKGWADLYHRYEETFWYLVFGGLTTLLNLAVFYVLYEWMHIDTVISNVMAWGAGVLFAFVTNKLFVFRSGDGTERNCGGSWEPLSQPASFPAYLIRYFW